MIESSYMLAEFNLISPMGMAVLLALVGCLLLVAEAFFPSGGLLGLLSLASLMGSVYYAYRAGGTTAGLSFALGIVIVAPLMLVGGFKLLPKTSWGRALMGVAPRSEDVLPEDGRHALVGRVGIARSKMLPSGAVEIDGQMIDAVSQGQAIEPGQYVRVIEVRANRVVVRRAAANERPGMENPDDLLNKSLKDLGIDDDPLS